MQKITGHTDHFIWHHLDIVIGRQALAEWWKAYNRERQLHALERVPEIILVVPTEERAKAIVI